MKTFFKKRWVKNILLVIAFFAATIALLARPLASKDRDITWGVTFAHPFAKQFGLPWQDVYRAILEDLGVRDIRLVAYWDQIETAPGTYVFDDLDWMLDSAAEKNARVILAMGRKVPRWPECHVPPWAAGEPKDEQNRRLLEYLRVLLDRYEGHPAIAAWQIENEPFLGFGECPPIDPDFLDAEIALAREFPRHPVLVTDSGEIGTWYRAAKRGDMFGTTMYRQIQKDGIGTFVYPIPPSFFRIKQRIVRTLLWDFKKEFLVIELQGEPWMKRQLYETDPNVQRELLSPEKLDEYTRYAIDAHFDTYYVWGVEWWYWLKTNQNDPRYWEHMKGLIAGS
jgi:hypothetical protein